MKIKVAIASLAIATVVVAAFAFKAPQAPAKKLVGQWFEYIGPQASGAFASLSDARVPSNYQFTSSPNPTSGSGYLKNIFVDASEIDTKGTATTADDEPMVNISTTNAYTALGLAKSVGGQWSDLVHNNCTVDADNQP
jgi:hypothetical protein